MFGQRAWRPVLIGVLVLTMLSPVTVWAQTATPQPEAGSLAGVSPVALYEALLTSTFPDELLPEGAGPLIAEPWQDSNDADLAGAIGGVIFADGDPFASAIPAAVTYVVYPGADAEPHMYAMAEEVGTPGEIEVEGESVPAVVIADLGDASAVFTMVDYVVVYGIAPHSGEPDVETATALTRAGIDHLRRVVTEIDAGDATPAQASQGEEVLAALAAAPFPADGVPFEVGELVILPMTVNEVGRASGMIGELLVRDAERTYPYPLVFYRVFADEDAARLHVAGQERGGGDVIPTSELATPVGFDSPYLTTIQATLIDWPNVSTTVLVQVGSTVVVGNAPQGTTEQRHDLAMTLAGIAVRHLEDVAPAAIPTD